MIEKIKTRRTHIIEKRIYLKFHRESKILLYNFNDWLHGVLRKIIVILNKIPVVVHKNLCEIHGIRD